MLPKDIQDKANKEYKKKTEIFFDKFISKFIDNIKARKFRQIIITITYNNDIIADRKTITNIINHIRNIIIYYRNIYSHSFFYYKYLFKIY